MKKLLFLIQLTTAVMLYSSLSHADYDDHGWRGRDHGYGYGGGEHHHHRHHHRDYYPQPQVNYYYPQPQINYYPRPQPQVRYYPQPQAEYYPQRQNYQDPRSTQGLAGGVIGSVFGYQMGSGDPVATGLGAAAGSYIGNGMRGR